MDDDELLRLALELLDGPATTEELARAVLASGAYDLDDENEDDDVQPVADHIEGVLADTDATWARRDDVVVLVASFVDGMVLTHRITAEDLADRTVPLQPDLSVLDWPTHADLPIVGGEGVLRVGSASGIYGPPGWLDGFGEGDLVAFRRVGDRVAVERVDEPGAGEAESAALGSAAESWIREGLGEEEVPFLMEAMARDATLFRHPVRPVSELLVAAGLERRAVEWGSAGQPWSKRGDVFRRGTPLTKRQYGFSACCSAAFDRVIAAWDRFEDGETVGGRDLLRDLGHGVVARAFASLRTRPEDDLIGFAQALAASVPAAQAAPAHGLLALAHADRDDVLAAEAAFEEALAADPDLTFAGAALAEIVADRGHLERARKLAQRGRADDLIAWLEMVETQLRGTTRNVGRNDQCPCGSGKKFKFCCARAAGGIPAGKELWFVEARLHRYVMSEDTSAEIMPLAAVVATGAAAALPGVNRFELVEKMLNHPIVLDIATFEGGLGRRYLDERGPLLSESDRRLAEAILVPPCRLVRVEVVTDGRWTLVDEATGERLEGTHHVSKRLGSPDDLVLGRWLDADDPGFVGTPMLIPEDERDAALELLAEPPTALVLAEWFGGFMGRALGAKLAEEAAAGA